MDAKATRYTRYDFPLVGLRVASNAVEKVDLRTVKLMFMVSCITSESDYRRFSCLSVGLVFVLVSGRSEHRNATSTFLLLVLLDCVCAYGTAISVTQHM